jgi:hypothetical protein
MKKRSSISILALGLAATGFLSSPDAFAGAKENTAVLTQLSALGETYETATGSDIATAVAAAIAANPNLKPGVIAGEALKRAGAAALDAGTKVGQNLAANAALAAKINTIAADAAVTATTGLDADGSLVPDFAQEIVADNVQATTIAILAAKKSKTAIGAIIGGRAQELADDSLRTELASSSIGNTKLAGGAQSIAQYVGNSLTLTSISIADFASSVAENNLKLLTSIAPGAVASDPSKARAILDSLFSGLTLTTAANNASKLAKSMSLLAETEQVEQLAESFGAQVGANVIKSSSLNAMAKALIQGLVKRPTGSLPADTLTNKMDEIGEVGAYLLAAAAASPDFDILTKGKAKAASIVTGLLKSIILAAKDKVNPSLQKSIAADVAGSIALTLNSLNAKATPPFSTDIFGQIAQAFTTQGAATAKKILGAKLNKAVGADVTTALNDGITNAAGAAGKYEDGTITEDVQVGQVIDPVTDIRNG